MVESQEVLDEGSQNWNLIFGVIVHDLNSKLCGVGLRAVIVDLLGNETLVVREQGAISNGIVVRGPLAIKFHVVTSGSMARVIGNRVVVLGPSAVVACARIRHIVRVAERTIVDGVLDALVCLAAQKIVHGAVLHAQQDDVLDLVLHVLNGGGRTWGKLGRGGSGKSQHADESRGMHLEQFNWTVKRPDCQLRWRLTRYCWVGQWKGSLVSAESLIYIFGHLPARSPNHPIEGLSFPITS